MESPILFTEEVTVDNSQCKTPGAIFHTEVHSDNVSCKVDFPFEMDLTRHEARELQDRIHTVMESVLSRYWSDAFRVDGVRKDMTESMKDKMGEVYHAIAHTMPEEEAVNESRASAEQMFFKGQKVTLVDPWQVVDVVDVNEFGDRAQIKYYDCRDGGDITRWIGRNDVMERSSV
jgi:hypothetical protein